MKNVFKLILSIIVCGIIMHTGTSSVFAASSIAEGMEAARCDTCPKDLFGDAGVFKQITNTILYIVGIIAVVMLIIGGIKYVISGGDSKKVTDAKNTVLYAIIGLIVSFLAFAIVNFVIRALPNSAEDDESGKESTSLVLPASCETA